MYVLHRLIDHNFVTLQVVKIQDGCGSSYKVALNSALEFGIMYNPNKNREEALVSDGFNTLCIYSATYYDELWT